MPPEVSGLAEEVGRWVREGSAAGGAGGTKSWDTVPGATLLMGSKRTAKGHHLIEDTVLSYHMQKQETVKGAPLHQANASPMAVTYSPGDNSALPFRRPFKPSPGCSSLPRIELGMFVCLHTYSLLVLLFSFFLKSFPKQPLLK